MCAGFPITCTKINEKRQKFLEKVKKKKQEYVNFVPYLKIFGLVYCLIFILLFSNKINQNLNSTKIPMQTYS